MKRNRFGSYRDWEIVNAFEQQIVTILEISAKLGTDIVNSKLAGVVIVTKNN